MKSVLKGIILSLCMALTILVGSPITSHAEGCLDVRDYGYHRYVQRNVDTLVSSTKVEVGRAEFYVYDSNGNLLLETITTYKITETYKRSWYCVCGAKKPTDETIVVEYTTEKVHITHV